MSRSSSGKTRPVKVIPALTARTHLGEIMKRSVERGERFVVDRRGESQVVILSMEDFLANFVENPSSLKDLQNAARKKDLDTMTMPAINREVDRIRKQLSRGK